MKKVKKLTAFLLTFILILGVIPFTAFTVSAESYKIGYISGNGVNIREKATTASDAVAKVSKLTVNVLDSVKDANGATKTVTDKDGKEKQVVYTWYNVSYTKDSKTVKGYVREDLITVKKYTIDSSFKKKLSAFPESYHNDLMLLHAIYPNWKFVADKVPTTFTEAVAAQDTEFRKLVDTSYNSWRSMREGCFNWSTNKFVKTDGGRYGAEKKVIAYYMDPRNFLNANDIYVYMQQSFDDDSQTKDGIEEIVDGTFLDAKITDKKDKYYNKKYATAIRYAAKKSGVNAYVLAATIIQEQGTKGTTFTNGKAEHKDKKVYNFFNFNASGTTDKDILKNGSKYAYEQGWFTPTESILGGAKKYASGYISVGQDTYFYKNYNVLNPDKLWHQYAQNVADSLSSSTRLKTTYSALYDMALTFRIPVFESLPSSVSKLPSKSQKYNNYYFEDLAADGQINYNYYTTKYSLNVDGDVKVYYKLHDGATYQSDDVFPLKKGVNTISLKLKSQTGVSKTYKLTVTAQKDATLKVYNAKGYLNKEADGKLYYYVDGEKANHTTLVKHEGELYYVKKGVWDNTAKRVVEYDGKYYYIYKGKWRSSKTGLIIYKDKYYYIKKGMWDNTKKGLIIYKDKYYYIYKGKWSKDKTGLIIYKDKYYYIRKGKWAKTKTGLIIYKDKYYYIKKGKWAKTTTGLVKYKSKYYYIKKGKWSSKTNTLYKKSGKYYAIKKGKWYKSKAIITYSGKKYYVNKGYAQLKFSGRVKVGSKTYRIRKGKVV